MQTLIFRTKSKTTTLYNDLLTREVIKDFSFDNVTTVTIRDTGTYYEIMRQVSPTTNTTVPVARLPISMTNMLITND